MNILVFEKNKEEFDELRQALAELLPGAVVHEPVKSVVEGKRFFADNNEHVDLIIAEVKLLDGLSFYALSDAPADVPIIFLTDRKEYALKAFEFNSLSYLLKPLDREELRLAISKTRDRLVTDEFREELQELHSKHASYYKRFLIKTFNGEKIIELSQIRYFVSEHKTTYIKLHDGTSYEHNLSLGALEEVLNPRKYMRVNRKYIVPATEIDHFESLINGKELLVLSGESSPEIIISRDNRENVHKWLQGI